VRAGCIEANNYEYRRCLTEVELRWSLQEATRKAARPDSRCEPAGSQGSHVHDRGPTATPCSESFRTEARTLPTTAPAALPGHRAQRASIPMRPQPASSILVLTVPGSRVLAS
jgi:hypothetical protein